MPDIQINVEVAGADQAADDLKNIGNAAKDTGSDIKSAGSDISSTTQSLSSFKTSLAGVVGSFTAIGTGIINLVRNFTQMEQAQIRLDTANRRIETSAQAVTKAQEKYNDAVAKYGPNSEQARAAADKLKTTVEGYNIAVDRGQLQQQKFNETLASLAVEIVPNVIGVFSSIVGAISSFTTKGAEGVSLAGKLKQSFLDLVSGGNGVKGAMDTAGNAMSGLGTKAQTAGTSAGKLEQEVVQLGAGVSQAVPNLGRFTGGITNTAVAAERTAGPLGNIERSVASTAVEVGGAVAPLGAFAGGMTATGTAAEGVAGGLEAAAVSTGALSEGAVAATAETVALGAGVGAATVATAALTAGLALAAAAIIAYTFNIGGFRDKTNEAIDSAHKFLAIGWEGFAKKFEPVTKAIEGGVKALEDFIGKAGEAAKLDISGQFKAQPAPGKAPAPGGTMGTLDEVIAKENATVAKGTAGLIAMVNAMKDLADQRVRMEGLSKTGVANSNANAAAFAGETAAVKTVTQAEKEHADAVKKAAEEAKAAASAQKIYEEAVRRQQEVTKDLDAVEKSRKATIDELTQTMTKQQGQIQANNEILTNSVQVQQLFNNGQDAAVIALQSNAKALIENAGNIAQYNAQLQTGIPQQQAWVQGQQQQEQALQKSITSLNQSAGALQTFNQQLSTGLPQVIAYAQGWINYNRTLGETIQKTAEMEGAFDSFISGLASGNSQMIQFNAGFAKGEESIRKWVEGLAEAEGEIGGVRNALVEVADQWGVKLPAAVNASNEVLQAFVSAAGHTTDAIQKGFEGADKTLDTVVKHYSKFLEDINKPIQPGQNWQDFMQQRSKTWQEELDFELKTFGHFLSAAERQGIEGISRMTTGMNNALATLNLDLTFQNMPKFQQDWQQNINQMIAVTKTLPPGMQGPMNTVIALMQRLPVRTPQEAAAAMSFFQEAVKATQTPGQNLNPVINSMQQYLGDVGKTNADQTVNKFGTAATGATGGVDGLGNSMSTLTANTGFAASALKTLKEQWLDPLTETQLIITITADTGAATSAISTLTSQWITPLESGDTIIHVTADTGPATSAISTLVNQWITPLESGDTIIQVTANTGPAVSALSALVNQWITPLEGQTIIQVTANTGPAVSALSALVNQWIIPLEGQTIIQVTANTGPAVSAISTLVNQWIIPLEGQTIIPITANTGPATSAISALQGVLNQLITQKIIQITANTGPAAQAIDALGNQHLTPLTSHQWIIQITANTGPAANAIDTLGNQHLTPLTSHPWTIQINANTQAAQQAIQQLQNTVSQLVNRTYTITITANTGPAASAINALQAQLNALRASGTATGIPLGFARAGGLFELMAGGFKRTKRGDQLHAAHGGAFIISKETRLGNLTVGEGNKPEMLQFTRARGGHGIGMLMVTPIKVPRMPRLHAQGGGFFFTPGSPNFGGSAPPTPGGFQQSGGAPIEFPAGTMAPVQTVGQGGPQQGMPSEVGAGTILVGPGGQAQPGPVTSPPGGGPAGGFGGLIPGAPSAGGGATQQQTTPSSTTTGGGGGGGANVSPYQMANLTGQSVAHEMQPAQRQMQADMQSLLAMIRKLIRQIAMRDINANLLIDGQKMASTVSKYIASGAYGGR